MTYVVLFKYSRGQQRQALGVIGPTIPQHPEVLSALVAIINEADIYTRRGAKMVLEQLMTQGVRIFAGPGGKWIG